MAFDKDGYRQAAMSAGVPMATIEQTIAGKTGLGGWLTGGKQGLVRGGWNTAMNILSLPSYAAGGLLNRMQLGGQSQYGQGEATPTGIIEGIKNKRALMTEAPETLGIDPNSGLGKAIGFGAEVLMPNIPVGKVAGIGKKVDNLSDAARATVKTGARKAGQELVSEGQNILTKGMGSPKALGKAKNIAGMSIPDLFKKYDLYERSPEAFQDAIRKASTEAKGMLTNAPASIDTRRVINLFDEAIAEITPKATTSTKYRKALEELMARKQMFLDGIQEGNATPLFNDASKVYDIKSSFQGDVPPSSFGMPSQEIGTNLGTTKAYRTLLGAVEEQAPGIKSLGREQAALIRMREMAMDNVNKAATRQNANFTKLGGAGVGGILGGAKGAVLGYAGERVLNHPRFLSAASKGLTTAGEALQKGLPEVKNELFKKTLSATKKQANKMPLTAAKISARPPTRRSQVLSSPQTRTKDNVDYSPYKEKSNLTAEDFYAEIRKKRGY